MIIFLIILIVLGLLVMSTYNRLVRLRNGAEEAFKSINVFLKQRYDLIPNLVNTIKGYTQYESGTLEKIIALRNTAMNAGGKDGGAAENALSGALKSVFALAENYPDLKASKNFLSLQDQIEGTENRIAVARRDYIDAVQQHNTRVVRFPANLIASMFGIKEAAQFQTPAEERAAPKVQFDFDAKKK